MATVTLKNLKKVYPYSGDDAKKKKRKKEEHHRKNNSPFGRLLNTFKKFGRSLVEPESEE